MNKPKHTPGPWTCFDTSNHAHDYRLTKPDGSPLPVNAPYNDHSEQRANARLIAKAPDLLALLNEAVERWPQFETDEHVPGADLVDWFGAWLDKVRPVLAQVEGQADG
jgi:hypothetical protein